MIEQPGVVLGFLLAGVLMGGLLVSEMAWIARAIDQAKCQAAIENLQNHPQSSR